MCACLLSCFVLCSGCSQEVLLHTYDPATSFPHTPWHSTLWPRPSCPPRTISTCKLSFSSVNYHSRSPKSGCTRFSRRTVASTLFIMRDARGASKGAAFVTYATVEEADTAIFTLHNRFRMLSNRAVQVSYAKNSPNISHFGQLNALDVHQANRSNPLPDLA
jgi:RNA recognition motif-containing protein